LEGDLMVVIDAHVHIGRNRNTKYYTLTEMRRDQAEAGVDGAFIFAFPEDMYRTIDTRESRIAANEYVLSVARSSTNVYPFYFVWNDYIVPSGLGEYAGIKWHRHPDEPRYNYDDPKCERILREIRRLNMPVTLEEEFDNTVRFVKTNPTLTVIVPHIGRANGGYEKMEVFYPNKKVYFDTSVADAEAIRMAIERAGPERVLFGTDVSGTRMPFYNFPKVELAKLRGLKLEEEVMRLILGGNAERLMEPWHRRRG